MSIHARTMYCRFHKQPNAHEAAPRQIGTRMATLLQVLIPTAEDWSRSFNTVRRRNSGERDRGSRLSHKQQGKCSHPTTQMSSQTTRKKEEACTTHPNCSSRSSLSSVVTGARSISLRTDLGAWEVGRRRSVGGDRDVWMKVRGAPAQAHPVQPPLMGPAHGPGKLPTRLLASG